MHFEKLRESFESEIKNKIEQKSKPPNTSETYTIKAFKFFDLMNTGYVNCDNFIKAIQKCGSSQDVNTIEMAFNYYDLDRDGKLNYFQFISSIFGTKAQGQINQNPNSENVLYIIRKKLSSKGMKGIFSLISYFLHFNSSDLISLEDFLKFFRELRINVENSELVTLFKSLDSGKVGTINFREFITLLVGKLSTIREFSLKKAFENITMNREDSVDVQDLLNKFNENEHPAVIEGRKGPQSIKSEFTELLTYYLTWTKKGNNNVKLNYQEFIEMYTFYSFSIEKDELFNSIINGTWTKKKNYDKNEEISNIKNNYEDIKAESKLPIYKSPVSNAGTKSIYSQQPSYQSQSIQSTYTKGFPNVISCEYPKTHLIMLERLRKILSSKGPKIIIELLRQFKICDDSNRWIIKRDEFKNAILEFKLDLDHRDIEGVCSAMDKFCNNEVDLNDFKIAVIGQLKDFRKNLINRVFENFDQEEANCVLLSHIKSCFNAKLHPDVKLGKRKEEEVLKEFFEMIDMHHSIINNFTSQIFVSRDEFFEFYSILSSCIEADSMFDQHVTNCWNLTLSSNLSKLPYAGISAKIYHVNSKEQWKYDNHKQLYNPDNLRNDFPNSSPSMMGKFRNE